MKSKRYIICLFAIALCTTSLTGQQLNNKLKKSLSPSVQQTSTTTNLSQTKSLSNISKNLLNFMNKLGLQPNGSSVSTTSSQPYNFFQTNNNNKLQLPSFDSLNNNSIEKVVWNNETGTPRFIEMRIPPIQKGKTIQSITAQETLAKNFLNDNKSLLRIVDPQNEFSLEHSQKDDLGMTHVKFSQVYQGIDIWGKEIIVHLDSHGDVLSLNGTYEQTPTMITDLNGKLDKADAISITLNDLKNKTSIDSLLPQLKKLLDYNGPIAKKIIWYDKNHFPHLAWNVEVISGLSEDWLYFIDAQTGSVLNYYNAVCYDGPTTGTGKDLNGMNRTFGTYQVGPTYYMIDASQPMFNSAQSTIPNNPVGAIVNFDLQNHDFPNNSQMTNISSTNNQWNDPTAVSAHYNATVTYKYFLNTFNRNSIDGNGMTINSIVHVTDKGMLLDNARWNGKFIYYGDGATLFKPLAGALDIAAHEMTHGITQYTANLEYQDQSGALNESLSDVFGTLVDTLNWTLGEQVIKDFNSFPSGALRDMANPHNGGTIYSWQPSRMSEFNNTTNDNGGVHKNSGIPNRAFYLVAKNIGRLKAGRIWYRTLTLYLTRSSQFIDARIATIKAATDLYGDFSLEVATVKNAWDAVEVFDGNSTPLPPPSKLVGDQWILVTTGDLNSIYIAKTTVTSSSDLFLLSSTPVLNRPAVTDVSGIILFVDKQNNLRALNANPQNPQETILDNRGVWRGVTVGPGLSSIALVSIYADTTIYYLDLVNNISKTFKIVAQAYDGSYVKTALYADALSFDPTGRYLLFDTYNEVKNSLGYKISYWNINLLDIQKGYIESVFPPQPQGINVGNPSFSKTSPTRFTFDYLDSQKKQTYILAADFNTANVGTVAGPLTVLGYPTYSADDKTIAYHTLQTNGTLTQDAVQQMPLKDDMIEGTGYNKPYLLNATFPYWFVIGSRITDVKDKPEDIPTTFALLQNYPNPFNPTTKINFSIPQKSQIKLKVFDVLGREIQILADGIYETGKYEIEFNAANLPSGVYFYNLTNGMSSITKKMLLIK